MRVVSLPHSFSPSLSLSLSIRTLALNYITTATPARSGDDDERRSQPLGTAGRRRFACTSPNRHDGCLYEAVIYFIIGGRGCYNPQLGNEAIYEERQSAGVRSVFSLSLCLS